MAEQKEKEQTLDGTFKFAEMSGDTLKDLATLAERAECYEDMVVFTKAMVEKRLAETEKDGHKTPVLQSAERNLFSVAYKNVVGSRRQAWRSLQSAAEEDKEKDLIQKYQAKVAEEIRNCCVEIQGLLEKLAAATAKVEGNTPTPDPAAEDSKKEVDDWVFYKKMMGDYYRYLREVFADNDTYKDAAQKNYEEAMEKAKKTLEPTNPTRLGLALNFSVCNYEILNDGDKACALAKEAFDEAIEKLDSLNDASYKDSTLIMQLLRDNLTIWTKENEDGGGDQENE